MDPITQQVVLATAGAGAAGEEALYVDDVFSTYLYEGNGSTQTIRNGIRIGNVLRGYFIYATQGGNYTFVAPSGTSWQNIITDGILSGNNDNYVYSDSSVLDIYVDLVDTAVATAVKIAPQGDIGIPAVYNTPSSLTVYGSNDASSWTTLDTNTGLSSSNFTAGAFTTFSFSNSTAYRYYRIAAPAFTSISELELVATSETAGEGGLVWIKNRNSAANHRLGDTERGTTKYLITNAAVAEATSTNTITSYNNNGFDLSTGTQTNQSGDDFVSWTFRKAPGFFDVVTYTGNSANRTIAHNLGSVPGCIIIKRTDSSENWAVYHRSLATNEYLSLNLTNEKGVNSFFWNNTAATDSVFSLGANGTVNQSGGTYVAYIFAHDDQSFGTNGDESIIKCGTYEGNGGTLEVDLGFEPQWLMIKNIDSASDQYGDADWTVYDMMRGFNAQNSEKLHPNLTSVELSGGRVVPTPTGFKIDNESNIDINASGDTYIYMAIRRPHKPPTAATEVFSIGVDPGSGEPSATSGFPVDMAIRTDPNSFQQRSLSARLIQGKFLYTNTTDAEISVSNFNFDYQNGVGNISITNYYYYMFRRAPGFFDVVAYTGTGSATTIAHNLGVVPEMVIHKHRSISVNWTVWHYDISGGDRDWWEYGGNLNTNFAFNTKNQQTSAPTSTTWPVDGGWTNAIDSTNIIYFFATLDGISKVGSYTGTGSNIDVDCGFTAGARFVMIKRTDSTGDWYVWDTTRGIVSGNDPYFLLNSNVAGVTTTDYIDPLNAGFTVTSSAPADLNASGGTYIFLAIA